MNEWLTVSRLRINRRNSRGGFLMDNEDDDPRAKREREQMARNAAQRLANANKQGILRDPSKPSQALLPIQLLT